MAGGGLLLVRAWRLTAAAVLSFIVLCAQTLPTTAGAGNGIEESAAWRIALFLGLFLLISTLLELFFHHAEHACAHKGLYGHLHAIEKIKEELMLLGFISLILLALENELAKICVDNDFWVGVKCPGHVIITDGTPKIDAYHKLGYYGPLPAPAPAPAPAPYPATAAYPATAPAPATLADGYSKAPTYEVGEGKRRRAGVAPPTAFPPPAPATAFAAAPGDRRLLAVDPHSNPNDGGVDEGQQPPQDRRTMQSARSGRKLLAAAGSPDPTCDKGSSSFLEVAAMHQIHILIFLIAVCHITFTMIALELSRLKVKQWTSWEFWGDDPCETAEMLRPPKKAQPEPMEFLRNLYCMFFKTVDPFGYICFRRYYISKNGKPDSFEYEGLVLRSLQNDFKSVVGVSSWMWLIVMFQVLAEGYHFGKIYITLIVSVTLTCAVGTKMMYIYNHVVREVLKVYDDECDGKISQADLDRIQKEGATAATRLKDIEPRFWKRAGPHMILQVVRFALFTASMVVAEAIFYAWQVKTDACYFDDRAFGGSKMPHDCDARRRLLGADKAAYVLSPGSYYFPNGTLNGSYQKISQDETPWVVVIMACIAVLLVVLVGLVTIPAYVILNTAHHHKHDQQALHRKLHGAHKFHAASHTKHDATKELGGTRTKAPTPPPATTAPSEVVVPPE